MGGANALNHDMTLHHTSNAPKHVLCRLSRSPLPLFGIVLMYLVYIVAFQDKGGSLFSRGDSSNGSSVSLRATSAREEDHEDGSLDERLSEDAQWEPDPEWTSAERAGVKGGVEIYPVQVCFGISVSDRVRSNGILQWYWHSWYGRVPPSSVDCYNLYHHLL